MIVKDWSGLQKRSTHYAMVRCYGKIYIHKFQAKYLRPRGLKESAIVDYSYRGTSSAGKIRFGFHTALSATTATTRMTTRLCILGDHLEVKGNMKQGEKALGSASKAPT